MIDAYSLAKIQEELLLNCRKNSKSSWSTTHNRGSQLVSNYNNPKMSFQGPYKPLQTGSVKGGETARALLPIQKISYDQMEERRMRGLCYSYDAKWTQGMCVRALSYF
jgi:hypothetical protein